MSRGGVYIWKPGCPSDSGVVSAGCGCHTEVPARSGRSLHLLRPFFALGESAGGHSCSVERVPRLIHLSISLMVPFESGSPDWGMRSPSPVPLSFWMRKLSLGLPGTTRTLPEAAGSAFVTGRLIKLVYETSSVSSTRPPWRMIGEWHEGSAQLCVKICCTVRNGRMPRPQPTAASHFATALLHAREKLPAEMASFTTRLTHFMYLAPLAAPAQSHSAAMLVRMSAIAVGFWQRAVVQSPSGRRVTAGTPVRTSRDAIASTWTLAPFIRYPPWPGQARRSSWVPCEGAPERRDRAGGVGRGVRSAVPAARCGGGRFSAAAAAC